MFLVEIVHVTALCFDDSFANPPPSLTELHQVYLLTVHFWNYFLAFLMGLGASAV